MKKYAYLFVFLCSIWKQSVAQEATIGLMQFENGSFEGYTLFASNPYTSTYLIDNCGRLVNEWPGKYFPGSVNYLLEDGHLLRSVRKDNASFFGGGSGGRIEKLDWEGNMIWSFNYTSNEYHQHHDIEALPNGNVLILAWELKTFQEVIDAGRNPTSFTSELWPDHIVEVQPEGLDGGTIVWEWHIWDHLVQDFDSTKNNFGVVAEHPELININFVGSSSAFSQSDWNHCNAIDYNDARDEIVVSSKHFSEFWIIDHSTTTEEAAGHSGGNSGKGGDILYRWGNPKIYNRGTDNDQQLYGQHDVHWIPDGLPNAGKLMLYNNGTNRPGGNASSVDILAPPIDGNGHYILEGDADFGPEVLDWTYFPLLSQDFYSATLSGAQMLPNGNILICEGRKGHLFEINIDQNIVWDYVCPISSTGPQEQGSPPTFSSVFRTYRYGFDYSGFEGKDLSAGSVLELNPVPGPCDTLSVISSITEPLIAAFPNPFNHTLTIQSDYATSGKVRLINVNGQEIYARSINGVFLSLQFDHLAPGWYYLFLPDGSFQRLLKQSN